MLKAILQTVVTVFIIGIVYVGVKWSLKKLGLTPLEAGQLSREQEATVDTKARVEFLKLSPILRDAQEADEADRKARQERDAELAKAKVEAIKAKKAAA